jgi:hypothetical protein
MCVSRDAHSTEENISRARRLDDQLLYGGFILDFQEADALDSKISRTPAE